jgi:hypothetical protein
MKFLKRFESQFVLLFERTKVILHKNTKKIFGVFLLSVEALLVGRL